MEERSNEVVLKKKEGKRRNGILVRKTKEKQAGWEWSRLESTIESAIKSADGWDRRGVRIHPSSDVTLGSQYVPTAQEAVAGGLPGHKSISDRIILHDRQMRCPY